MIWRETTVIYVVQEVVDREAPRDFLVNWTQIKSSLQHEAEALAVKHADLNPGRQLIVVAREVRTTDRLTTTIEVVPKAEPQEDAPPNPPPKLTADDVPF